MGLYSFTGLDAKGRPIKGVREADNERILRQELRREGIFVEDVKPAKEKGRGLNREVDLSFLRSVDPMDVALATRQLATLLKASVPLTEALLAISDQLTQDKKRQKLGQVLSEVRQAVNEGTALADALARHPKIFSEYYVSMARSGEAAGNLDVVLSTLAEFLERQHNLKSKIKSAMTYPIVMGIIAVVFIAILMTFVVPNMVVIFEDFDQALPWNTQLLISVSNFFSSYWFHSLVALLLMRWGFRRWRQTPRGRAKWDSFVLSMPLFGEMVRKVAIARFASTLGTMLHSGVPILKALGIVKAVMGNRKLEAVIDEVATAVREGESMASVLQRSGEFPPLVIHMIAIGEKSGELEAMLHHVSDTYNLEIDTTLNRLTSVLEPMMILIMGGTVGFIVFSILMPIMQMNSLIQ